MNHYDTTALQTKTCGKVAGLIEDMIDTLFEKKGGITKKRKVLMEAANFLRQFDEAMEFIYAGSGGKQRLRRKILKE